MNGFLKTIVYIGVLFTFCNCAFAESLYNSNIQARLTDEDKDGVIDARDQCPDTEEGAAVNNVGCAEATSKLLSVELNVLFDSGKAVVKPRFYSELKKLAVFLKDHPKSSVVIEGHTDNVGSEETNQELSQARASAIANVLIDSFRIGSDRVKAIGYGESRPIASNDTDAGKQRNRRVVAEVFAKQQSDIMRWTIYSVDKNSSTALFTSR